MYKAYSIPYILFFLVIILLFLWNNTFQFCTNKSLKKSITLSSSYTFFLVIIFFLGCRGLVGADWPSYYSFFNSAPSLRDGLGSFSKFNEKNRYEIGFTFYVIILKTVSENYLVFQFISTLIDTLVIIKVFNEYCPKYSLLAAGFWCVFGGCFLEITILRNVKSILLFILSIKYIRQRKVIKYFFLNAIGILFHSSSIFYFPLYFLMNIKRRKNFEIFLFLIGNVILLLHIHWLKSLLSFVYGFLPESVYKALIYNYLHSEIFGNERVLSIGFLERTVTFILFFRYMNKQKSKYNLLFWYLFLIYSCFYYFCSELDIIVSRVGGLFECSYWFLYPKFYGSLKKERKYLFIIVFIFYSVLKLMIIFDDSFSFYENFITGASNVITRRQTYF